MNCGICGKLMMNGDYIYGACNSCARRVIKKAMEYGLTLSQEKVFPPVTATVYK